VAGVGWQNEFVPRLSQPKQHEGGRGDGIGRMFSSVLSGRKVLRARFPATMWLANFRCSFGAKSGDKFLELRSFHVMSKKTERERFMEIVEIIKKQFPNLRFEMELEHRHVDALLTIPPQAGLKFEVMIDLQNCDELYLYAGSFHCPWFPCGKEEVFNRFSDALRGLLSGTYRIVEYSRGNNTVKAELQRPVADKWERVKWWTKLHIPIPWRTSTRILQNI
jgi:hypothetical protein